MHGLIGRALECFLKDMHGGGLCAAALRRADLPADGFRSTRQYPVSAVQGALREASAVLGLPVEALLTDLGVWIVSRKRNEPLRRLVRFGGGDFRGFLYSLEDLPARGRLAMPDLELPRIALRDGAPSYEIRTQYKGCGAGWVLCGLLRGMADDYGALAVVEHRGIERRKGVCTERVSVEIADDAHSAGRGFELAPEWKGAA